LKVLTILGARPQFIKASPVCNAFQVAGVEEILVHTGQHYDAKMSDVFFEELEIPKPKFNLGIGSGGHGKQTGAMLVALEEVMLAEKPDVVLVYGDTNSTLAGAIAACKLGVPLAHVEAGLRSFNRSMPEEHNRVLTDHAADFLFCPTQTAVDHLLKEGIQGQLVGDTMYDAVLKFSTLAKKRSQILTELGLSGKDFYLATLHRPYNTDFEPQLKLALESFGRLQHPVIFPVHPRTRQKISSFGIRPATNVKIIEPVGYLDMLALQEASIAIMTDSGGVQKEAFFLRTPCVTMRTETEWVETVEAGWNVVTGVDPGLVTDALQRFEIKRPDAPGNYFGDGHAAEKIVRLLLE
jgi:UDP-GlcNAc3NAcA epimerase